MENNELIKIWNTLAEKKLIDRDLAMESIRQILTKEGGGIIHKMIKKAKVDYYIFLTAIIIVPLFIVTAHLFFPPSFPNSQSYIGLLAVELFFIYMLNVSIRNKKLLTTTFNELSIRDSIQKVDNYLKMYLRKYFYISLVFGYIFLLFALLQFLLRIGGPQNISISSSGFNFFASNFIIGILALMIIWPFLIKFEIRIRFSGTKKEVTQLLNELNEKGNV
jgi:hypothetical protein